ncbi:MAG: nitroreductase family protein [Mycobacteriaceae bacterium]
MAAATIDQQALASVVQLACRAPSLHNSQPWHLIAGDGELRVFLEPYRAPRATDLTGRETLISCGALLDHLKVAAAAGGWNAEVAHFPNPNDLNHLATIEFHPTELITDAARARADAILARRTDRLPFAAPAGWAYIEPLLRDAVDPELATLHVLPDSARPQVAQASRLTETFRRYDNAYHAELDWWTASFEAADGVPRSSLASPSERDRVDVARSFPLGGRAGRRPEVDHDQAAIAVLSTDGDDRRSALGCGEAMSGVLLEATLAGLATCPVSHITELAAGRDILRALTGSSDDPQLLIRIGQVPALENPPPPTPRRPLADVLEVRL